MKKRGFTLLELLIVIIILGILAAIAMPRYFANLEKARETEAKSTLDRIREVELAYFGQNGAFTDTFPISVNMSRGASPDIYLAEPQSANFTYTLVTASKYGKAARVTGANDYYMCFESGRFVATTAPTCP